MNDNYVPKEIDNPVLVGLNEILESPIFINGLFPPPPDVDVDEGDFVFTGFWVTDSDDGVVDSSSPSASDPLDDSDAAPETCDPTDETTDDMADDKTDPKLMPDDDATPTSPSMMFLFEKLKNLYQKKSSPTNKYLLCFDSPYHDSARIIIVV